ncbi:C-type lectin domain family 4 member M-like [Diorhabda sublineata]|uniref:C-type lectin domain family 4 member M-like n=1 Tax=Diorhabda sublineata TaxID=1163346 RepID=UPI0024E0ECB7|nr:C-type lectin domain family 4 member M-like [Diorhabda sublineata]
MFRYLLIIFFMVHHISCQDEHLFTSNILPRNNNSNYLDFQGHTYFFNTEYETNLYESIRYCKQLKMELVSIESASENDRLGLYIIERGLQSRRFWTSAVNMVDGGKWVWLSTGEYIKYFNWDAGEPTGTIPLVSSYENCIQVRHEGNRGFTWNDLNCGKKNFAICEKPSKCTCSTVRGV